MTKPAIPGQVKTRLTRSRGGDLTDQQAAAIHAAMLRCITRRLTQLPCKSYLMAVEGGWLGSAIADGDSPPHPWGIIDQGSGDLGSRLDHVWRAVDGGSLAFFGTDTPDVPMEAIESVPAALAGADAALGPVSDGGYWTLAADGYRPQMIAGIDWGTANVYHQTLQAAHQAGLRVAPLPAWHDVDEPADLVALRRRLVSASEPALAQLARDLDRICPAQAP